jgi:hypothetical protein
MEHFLQLMPITRAACDYLPSNVAQQKMFEDVTGSNITDISNQSCVLDRTLAHQNCYR